MPTTRDAKYKAKAAIDTFFWRTGGILQAVVVFTGTQLALMVDHFAIVNLVFVVTWLVVVVLIAREHKKISHTIHRKERKHPSTLCGTMDHANPRWRG